MAGKRIGAQRWRTGRCSGMRERSRAGRREHKSFHGGGDAAGGTESRGERVAGWSQPRACNITKVMLLGEVAARGNLSEIS